jgi:hypothetical protein
MRTAEAASVCPVLLISRWLYPRPMAAQSLAIREPVSTHPGCCLMDALTGVVATLGDDGVLAQAIKHRLKPAAMSALSSSFNMRAMLNPRGRGPQAGGPVPRHMVLPCAGVSEKRSWLHPNARRVPDTQAWLSSRSCRALSLAALRHPAGMQRRLARDRRSVPPHTAQPSRAARLGDCSAIEISNTDSLPSAATSPCLFRCVRRP